jgi:hypothetical protein
MSDFAAKNDGGTASPPLEEIERWRAQFDAAATDAGSTELNKSTFLALAMKVLRPGSSQGGSSKAQNDGPSLQDLDTAFTVADKDRSGGVDRQEFVAFMKLATTGQVAGLSSDAWYNPGAWGKKAEYKKKLSAATKDEVKAAKTAASSKPNIEVIRMWELPDGFFELPLELQWKAIAAVTSKAEPRTDTRVPCSMNSRDDALAVAFFLVTLGVPIALGLLTATLVVVRAWTQLASLGCLAVALALHPMPRQTLEWRSSHLCLCLLRYFTFEFLIDRNDPLVQSFATPAVDSPAFQANHLPAMYLACPHGVFNYGAIIW